MENYIEEGRMRKVTIFGFILLLFIGCETSTDSQSKRYSVRYEVTGTAKTVFITIENDTGGTSQYADVSIPWTYNFRTRKEEGTFVYVSAQNQGETGSVTASIYRDEVLFKTSTSSGSYVIATASGSL